MLSLYWVFAASCASIRVGDVTVDKLLRERTVVAEQKDIGATSVSVNTSAEGVEVTAIGALVCHQFTERVVQRTVVEQRKVQPLALVAQYVIGAGLSGYGTGVLIDAPNVPTSDTRTVHNPIGRSDAYAIGVSSLVVGVGFLAFAVDGSINARDHVLSETEVSLQEKPSDFECGRAPDAKQQVSVTGKHDSVIVGETSENGKLSFSWAALERLVAVKDWPRSAEVRVGKDGKGGLELEKARAFAAESAWAAALGSNEESTWRSFIETFPEAHVSEAVEQLTRTRLLRIEAGVRDVIATSQFLRLMPLWNEWQEIEPNSSVMKHLYPQLVAGLLGVVEVSISKFDQDPVKNYRSFDDATDGLGQLTVIAPKDLRVKKVQKKSKSRARGGLWCCLRRRLRSMAAMRRRY